MCVISPSVCVISTSVCAISTSVCAISTSVCAISAATSYPSSGRRTVDWDEVDRELKIDSEKDKEDAGVNELFQKIYKGADEVSLRLCVCALNTHTRMCTHTQPACAHVLIHARMHTQSRAHTHTLTPTGTVTHARTDTRACMHTHTHACTDALVQTQSRMHTQTHAHAHSRMRVCVGNASSDEQIVPNVGRDSAVY